MNRILGWITKKKLILVSLISSILFLFLVPRDMLWQICPTRNSTCIDLFNYLLLVLMFGATILIPSVITFFMRDSVVESWKKTLFVYFFIYFFIVIITPWYYGDEFMHIQKDILALLVSGCYLIFSLILILFKSLKKDPVN